MKLTSVLSTWAALMGVAVWAVLSACSVGPSESEADSDTLGSQTLNTSVPETDTEGPDPDDGGNGGPAVQLPEIPIGGSSGPVVRRRTSVQPVHRRELDR